MVDVWTFGPIRDSAEHYADGTTVPHRAWQVLLNGTAIGELELHCHRRRGPDGRIDVSYGLTAVTYGPPPGGS
jgi:hypothetical protein